jgi:hypothetical protein
MLEKRLPAKELKALQKALLRKLQVRFCIIVVVVHSLFNPSFARESGSWVALAALTMNGIPDDAIGLVLSRLV